jgi:hypothetical protein
MKATNQTKRLTSVKVEEDLFDAFKEMTEINKFTFQKLADRCLYLYITDPSFKKLIEEQTEITLNGK